MGLHISLSCVSVISLFLGGLFGINFWMNAADICILCFWIFIMSPLTIIFLMKADISFRTFVVSLWISLSSFVAGMPQSFAFLLYVDVFMGVDLSLFDINVNTRFLWIKNCGWVRRARQGRFCGGLAR